MTHLDLVRLKIIEHLTDMRDCLKHGYIQCAKQHQETINILMAQL